jgi:hypothetical protein
MHDPHLQQLMNDILYFHSYVQKGVYKDIHLVVDFLESGECDDHVLLKRGVKPFGVSKT